MIGLIYTDFANPIFAFCGYMGMKVSAYLNPLMHRINMKVYPDTVQTASGQSSSSCLSPLPVTVLQSGA